MFITLICIGENIIVLFVCSLYFLMCVCFGCYLFHISNVSHLFFSCILLSLRALCFRAVALFANLMCLYLDTRFDILTCMCKVIFAIFLFDKNSRNIFMKKMLCINVLKLYLQLVLLFNWRAFFFLCFVFVLDGWL